MCRSLTAAVEQIENNARDLGQLQLKLDEWKRSGLDDREIAMRAKDEQLTSEFWKRRSTVVCLFVYLVMVSLCPNSGIAANWFIVAIQWEKNNFMSLWHPGVAFSNEWLRLSNFTWWKPHQSRSLTPSTSNCLQPASSKSLRVVCVCVCASS